MNFDDFFETVTWDELTTIPDGYYALDDEPIRFLKVVHKEVNGKRYVNVRHVVADGSSVTSYPIRHEKQFEILKLINEDIEGHARLFVDKLVLCHVCGRPLTDETSREAGLGPICRRKRDAG